MERSESSPVAVPLTPLARQLAGDGLGACGPWIVKQTPRAAVRGLAALPAAG
jgi:hypothetical protein